MQDHLRSFPSHVLIATDASQDREKAGVGIFSPSLDWSFSLRLPDFTPIFLAELLAVILALRKLESTVSQVVVMTDSLSICSSLSSPTDSRPLRLFKFLIPLHLNSVRLLWVPGHMGFHLNEVADSLARASLSGPIVAVLPSCAYTAAVRFRSYTIFQEFAASALTSSPEYQHLLHPWSSKDWRSRRLEVSFTRLRCRVPLLNFYLHRSGLAASPLCPFCAEPETIDHFLLFCRRFSHLRKRLLQIPFHQLGLPVSSAVVLSIGASLLGRSDRSVRSAVQNFLQETQRLPF